MVGDTRLGSAAMVASMVLGGADAIVGAIGSSSVRGPECEDEDTCADIGRECTANGAQNETVRMAMTKNDCQGSGNAAR